LAVDPRWHVVESRETASQRILLVRVDAPGAPLPDRWQSRSIGVEELALGYLRESPGYSRPVAVEATR
jgi:hypothetical protein